MDQTSCDNGLKRCKILVIPTVEHIGFHTFPEPFNQIEVGGIGRQVEQLKIERGGKFLDIRAFLIPGVISSKRNRDAQLSCCKLVQQFGDTVGIEIPVVDNGDEFVSDGIQGPEYIQAVSPGRGLDTPPTQTPQKSETRRHHKMDRIDKQ